MGIILFFILRKLENYFSQTPFKKNVSDLNNIGPA